MIETAKTISYKFECKKDALRQTQDGGVKVTLSIHPNEMPQELYKDSMGQRYMAVLVPLNDDETPREKNYTAAAKLLSKNKDFQRQINASDDLGAEAWIENQCGVKSCSQIKDGTEAGKKFARIYAQFQDFERTDLMERQEI